MATNKKVTKTDIIFDDKRVTLKSTYDKAGIKYFIQPCKNKYGQYPSCIKKVNSQGDMIMSEKERDAYSEGRAVFFPENHIFVVTSGKSYNLDDPYEKAEWEAIENCPLIAKSRDERDANGNLTAQGQLLIIQQDMEQLNYILIVLALLFSVVLHVSSSFIRQSRLSMTILVELTDR